MISYVKTDRSLISVEISVESPRDPSHGDVATNAAMVLAKPLGTNPRALADQIVAKLKEDPEVAGVSASQDRASSTSSCRSHTGRSCWP